MVTVFCIQASLALIGLAMLRRLCERNVDDVCEGTLVINKVDAQVAPANGLAAAVKQSIFSKLRSEDSKDVAGGAVNKKIV